MVYLVLKAHKTILRIDEALAAGDVVALMDFLDFKQLSTLFNKNVTDYQAFAFCEDNSTPGFGCIENHLRVTHAELIADLEEQFKDDPKLFLFIEKVICWM